jgi:hypothetical protein
LAEAHYSKLVAVAVDRVLLPALVDLESVVLVAQVPEMLRQQTQAAAVVVPEALHHQVVVLAVQELFM